MPKVYISYRPEDSSRNEIPIIEDRLIQAFGAGNILKSTGSNSEITTHLQRFVLCCDVLLVVIGRYWLDMVDEDGERLLDDPFDPIRVEIDTGLQTLMAVRILVVDAGHIPKPSDLPDSLKPLLKHDMIEALDDNRLRHVLDELTLELSTIPTGMNADERYQAHLHEQMRQEDDLDTVQRQYATPNSSNWLSTRFLPLMVIFVSLCALLTVFVVNNATHKNPFVPPVNYQEVEILSLSATDIGFLYNGYLYAAVQREDRPDLIRYVDPQDPDVIFRSNTPLEEWLRLSEPTQLSDEVLENLATELDETISFYAIDEDDNRIIILTSKTILYILDRDSLELQSKHRLTYSRVRSLIQDETIIYSQDNNLLILVTGNNEISTWQIDDSPKFEGSQLIYSETFYIYEIAVNLTGEFLGIRGENQVGLYRIEGAN